MWPALKTTNLGDTALTNRVELPLSAPWCGAMIASESIVGAETTAMLDRLLKLDHITDVRHKEATTGFVARFALKVVPETKMLPLE